MSKHQNLRLEEARSTQSSCYKDTHGDHCQDIDIIANCTIKRNTINSSSSASMGELLNLLEAEMEAHPLVIVHV